MLTYIPSINHFLFGFRDNQTHPKLFVTSSALVETRPIRCRRTWTPIRYWLSWSRKYTKRFWASINAGLFIVEMGKQKCMSSLMKRCKWATVGAGAVTYDRLSRLTAPSKCRGAPWAAPSLNLIMHHWNCHLCFVLPPLVNSTSNVSLSQQTGECSWTPQEHVWGREERSRHC